MRWLIVEDALRDRKGHWLEYVSTFVRELRALGDEVVVLIALGTGFHPILTGREPQGWEARRTSNRRLARRVQCRREGSVLGLSKKSWL